MHISLPATLALAHLAVGSLAKCGTADACVGTDICTTATFTIPISTTVTTCVPAPTCLGVYANCVSGGTLGNCCSGYCAADKCRSTDKQWPGCREDSGPCFVDANCCYGNQCVKGLCTRVRTMSVVKPSARPSVVVVA